MTPKLPLIAGFILLLNTLVSYAQPDSPDNKPKLVIPYGHEGGIGSRFLSIDNRFFVCSDDHKTIIWDVRSGKPLHYLKGTNVVGSADGKLLVTCQQNEVMIWDLASGKSLHLFSIRGSIKSMSFHPLLRLLLVVSDEQEEEGDDKVVKVECYNMTSGKTVLLAGEDKNLQGIAGCGKCDHEHCPAADATFSKDGNFIHVATSKDIRTFSVADLKYAGSKCYPIPVDGAETIRFITNEVVEIYDTEADKATYCLGMKIIGTARSVNPHVLRAYNTPRTIPVSLSPDHRYLAYSGQRFRLIDITSPGKDVLNLEPVQQVYFNAMSSRILVEFEKVTTTAVYDIASAKAGGINAGKPDDGWPPYIFIHHPTMQLELNQKAIDSLWAPPKGDYDKEVFESEKKFYLDQYHEQWRTAQSFYVNGGYLVSLSTGRIISYLHSDIPSPKQSLLSPDGHTIFFSSDSGKFFYDLRNARLLSSTVINEPVQGTMAPDNKHCVFVGKSPAAPIYIYDYLKGKLTKAGTANTLTLPTDVTFSEDGKLYTLLTNSGYRTCPLNGLCPSPANRKKNKTPAKKVADEDDDDEEEEGGEEEEMEDGDEDGITHRLRTANPKSIVKWNRVDVEFWPDSTKEDDKFELYDLDFDLETDEDYVEYVTMNPNKKQLLIQLHSSEYFLVSLPDWKLVYESAGNTRAVMKIYGDEDEDSTGGEEEISPRLTDPETGLMDLTEFLSAGKPAAAYNKDGSQLLCFSADTAFIITCATGKVLRKFPVPGDRRGFNFTADLVLTLLNGQLKFYKPSTGKEWFAMVPFNNGEVAWVLPDGNYFAPKTLARKMGYQTGSQQYSYRQFDLQQNRPDLVLAAIGDPGSPQTAFYQAMYLKRMQQLGTNKPALISGNSSLPEIELLNGSSIGPETSEEKLQLKFRFSDKHNALTRYQVWVNNFPVYDSGGAVISGLPDSKEQTINVPLSEGRNSIETAVVNNAGGQSYRLPVYIIYSPKARVLPKVYFLGIGIDKYRQPGHNLHWCVNDITDLTTQLQKIYGNALVFDTILNSNVTVERVKAMKDVIKDCGPDDILITAYSGHGLIDLPKTTSFFGTVDIDFKNPSVKGLSLDHFERLMNQSGSRKRLLIIDACHSGKMDLGASGPKDPNNKYLSDPEVFKRMLEYFTDAEVTNGSFIIAGAQAFELTQEMMGKRNSALTSTILDAINNMGADLNKDNLLSIQELVQFVVRKNTLSGKRELRAVTRQENEDYDWWLMERKKR